MGWFHNDVNANPGLKGKEKPTMAWNLLIALLRIQQMKKAIQSCRLWARRVYQHLYTLYRLQSLLPSPCSVLSWLTLVNLCFVALQIEWSKKTYQYVYSNALWQEPCLSKLLYLLPWQVNRRKCNVFIIQISLFSHHLRVERAIVQILRDLPIFFII